MREREHAIEKESEREMESNGPFSSSGHLDSAFRSPPQPAFRTKMAAG